MSTVLVTYGTTEGQAGKIAGVIAEVSHDRGHKADVVDVKADQVASFSGALLYTQYGFLKRHLMKRISEDKPGNLGLDTSRDYVSTEWDGVKRFAEHLVDDPGRSAVADSAHGCAGVEGVGLRRVGGSRRRPAPLSRPAGRRRSSRTTTGGRKAPGLSATRRLFCDAILSFRSGSSGCTLRLHESLTLPSAWPARSIWPLTAVSRPDKARGGRAPMMRAPEGHAGPGSRRPKPGVDMAHILSNY